MKSFSVKIKKNNKLELEMLKHLEKINDHYEFLMYMFLFQINSGTHLLPFDYHRLANLNGILHRLLIQQYTKQTNDSPICTCSTILFIRS